jgi:DNA transformation protein
MKPLKNQRGYVDFVLEQLSPMGEITARSMFGGHCLYCDGIVFALIGNNVLYLKTDEVNRPDFENRGLEPFQPFEDKSGVMSYYAAPPEIFEDSDAMKRWVGSAVDAGRRAQAKKKRK